MKCLNESKAGQAEERFDKLSDRIAASVTELVEASE